MGRTLTQWEIEDPQFWQKEGKRIASRNLWASVFALNLAFVIWMVWSVVVVHLPRIGFPFTSNQLFWLAALPGLSGATLRILYSPVAPVIGGKTWTVLSTAVLLIPAVGIGWAVQHPDTSYTTFVILSLLCGLGGGNFASSMANISFFYPRREQGTALGVNGGFGDLGTAVVQFAVPLVITAGLFGALGGPPQVERVGGEERTLWLQNAGYFWVPLLVLATLGAWVFMNNIGTLHASLTGQAVIFRRKHTWIMSLLYTGTFGCYIGCAAGFPLLLKLQFPEVPAGHYVFLGALLGAVLRPLGGWLSDRLGGARVTLVSFALAILGVLGVLLCLKGGPFAGSFWGFFASYMLVFMGTGLGNGSTYRMVPIIFSTTAARAAGNGPADSAAREKAIAEANREAAAVLGFISAVAAYGAFFIPKSYGSSIELTGSPAGAFYLIGGFMAVCMLVTWWYYTRRGAEVRC